MYYYAIKIKLSFHIQTEEEMEKNIKKIDNNNNNNSIFKTKAKRFKSHICVINKDKKKRSQHH